MSQTAERAASAVRVLIADDQPQMRLMMRRALTTDAAFSVVGEAADGEEALRLLRRLRPDVALLDLAMPKLDGVGVIRAMREEGLRTPALVLTANGDADAVSAAIEAGADGYVLKGCRVEELRAAVREVGRGGAVLTPGAARSVVTAYQRMAEEKRARDLAVIRTLASAVEKRDQTTGDHANNVARLSLALWRGIVGTEPEDDLVYGFLLHDLGKIAVPDAILLKPGPLTEDELAVMRRHPLTGVEIIAPLGFNDVAVEVIRCHHERWDGTGYPSGLAGEQIPLAARVFSVADAYDAMTSDRPYRRGMSPADAVAEIRRHAGTQFDPDCAAGFERVIRDLGML